MSKKKAMDYIVTMHGFDHVRKFRCTENDDDADSDMPPTKKDAIALCIVLVILLFLQIFAIVDAASGLGISETYNADIMVSIFSPFIYWVLRLLPNPKLGKDALKT